MTYWRGVAVSLVFLMLLSGEALAQKSESEALPPEKTQIIYDTLLPEEGDRPVKTGEEDASQSTMTVEKVEEILRKENIDLQGKDDQWRFLYDGMQMFVLTDTDSNRIRIMIPLAKLDALRQNPDFSEIDLLQKMMKANYHATGDVRLCMNKGIIWAAFLHPLDSLTERDLISALRQLAETERKTRSDID